jgi:tRNA threonylcarbamoyladenosine biosynthesis protein TsaB
MKPSAVSIGLAGIERFQRGGYAGIGISPLYVQRTAAELKYEESGGLSPVAQRQERVARKVNARVVAARTSAVRVRAVRRRGTGGT